MHAGNGLLPPPIPSRVGSVFLQASPTKTYGQSMIVTHISMHMRAYAYAYARI